MAVAMNGTPLGGKTIRVSMAKSAPNAPSSASPALAHPALAALPPLTAFNPALAAAISAYSAALQPSTLMQAEAQARLLNLPAFNAQLTTSNIQLRNDVKPKKPHHDPSRVQRTVYVDNVAPVVNEQVRPRHIASALLLLGKGGMFTRKLRSSILCASGSHLIGVAAYVHINRYVLIALMLVQHAQVLADHFRQLGPIVAIRLASNPDSSNRKAWIEFAHDAAALAAQNFGKLVGTCAFRL